MCKEFEMMCEQSAHAKEIQTSRIGCLGGSDAAMVLKVGQKGIEALSNTDKKRLYVMLGLAEQESFVGNAATQAGHDFEEFMASHYFYADQREVRLEGHKYDTFQQIAHADFYNEDSKRVRELKCSKDKTEKVLQKYRAQLQWYYTLGAECVQLVHGEYKLEQGFIVRDVVNVSPEPVTIGQILVGLELIDAYCKELLANGVVPDIEQDEADDTLRHLLIRYETKKMVADRAEKELTECRDEILKYMQANGIASSKCGNIQVTYKGGGTQRRLDTAKVQAKYPNLTIDDEVWKMVQTKSSVTIKIGKNNESENN